MQFTPAIFDLGTYWAQRAADDGLVPHTAAHRRGSQDLESSTFLQATGLYWEL
jgi:hypothetical protein